jgi:hypothetical protein
MVVAFGLAFEFPVLLMFLLLARAVWTSVPDEGARALEPQLVPCDDLGPPGDVDSADDIAGGRFDAPPAE